jgi:hypothetical protein
VTDGAQRDLPPGFEGALHSCKSQHLTGSNWIDLVSIGLEPAERLGRQSRRDRWSHELVPQLIVSSKAEVQLLSKLSQEQGCAPLQCEAQHPAVDATHPHTAAQLVVIRQTQAGYSPGTSSNGNVERNGIAGSTRREPDGLIRFGPRQVSNTAPKQDRVQGVAQTQAEKSFECQSFGGIPTRNLDSGYPPR